MISINDVIKRLEHCKNPLYPDAFYRTRTEGVKRTWKGYRRKGWAIKYSQWIEDHNYHASKV